MIAILLVGTIVTSCSLWRCGGEKRMQAVYLGMTVLSFVMVNWLCAAFTITWESYPFKATPWSTYILLVKLPKGTAAYHHLLLCPAVSFLVVLLAWLAKSLTRNSSAQKTFGSAHFANAFEIKAAGLFSQHGIVLGKAYGKILRLGGFEGVLVTAPMGSGKTTAIAIPNLIEWQGSGVFNDLKGELYRLTAAYRQTTLGNQCYCWAPADEARKSHRYNPFAYVDKDPDLRVRDLQLIAETIIPSTRAGDSFWYQSSREIFLTLALYLFETQGMATLAEIHDLSKQASFVTWLAGEVVEKSNQLSPLLKQNAHALLSADEKTQKNILTDFHSRMSLFSDPLVRYATNNNDFDFRHLRKQKISIYIHIPTADKERLSQLLTLFWVQLINAMTRHEPKLNEEPYPVLALLDEFGNMARISKLKEGVSFLRSYRVRTIVIVQQLAQITSVYGRDDAKSFFNSKIKLAFTLNDLDDAQFFSRLLGKKAVRVKSSSINSGYGDNAGGQSQSTSYQSRALMTPDEIMKMRNKDAIILLEAEHPIKAKKCYWFKEPNYMGQL